MALRAIYENEEERKHHLYPEGIYLLTSGIPDQPLEVCCAYVEECNTGRSIHLHTILFNIDDYYLGEHGIQSSMTMTTSGRWANATKTAEFMRALAKNSGGRFLWFRETGIIESDDIKLLQNEIEKACQFSEQAASLVEAIKQKRRIREAENPNTSSKMLPIEHSSQKSVTPLVVRPTRSSAARQQMFESKDTNSDEYHWRPTSTNTSRNLIPEWPQASSTVPKRRKSVHLSKYFSFFTQRTFDLFLCRPPALKQESFYLSSQDNSKFSIIKNESFNKSPVKKPLSGNLVLIPTDEDIETSQVLTIT